VANARSSGVRILRQGHSSITIDLDRKFCLNRDTDKSDSASVAHDTVRADFNLNIG